MRNHILVISAFLLAAPLGAQARSPDEPMDVSMVMADQVPVDSMTLFPEPMVAPAPLVEPVGKPEERASASSPATPVAPVITTYVRRPRGPPY